MIGIFSMFGRSADQQLLDQTIRDAGLHPRLVPDAVKIVLQRQIKETGSNADERQVLRADLSSLLAYCMLGPDEFTDLHGEARTAAVELRLDHALMAGDNRDARMILLFMHAGLVNGHVTDRYGLALED
jgi:hypothetical protein